ncbi:50S ribosomal protein L13 [Patescibacteria group bacterium]
MNKTKTTKAAEIERNWNLFDAEDQVLGRLATKIAALLIGKNKPYFVPHLDCGDYVVVINAKKIKITGNKAKQKIYYRHSGFPGGFKETSFEMQMDKDPRKVIYHAVSGMLPKNKLRKTRLGRMKVFSAEKHSFGDKFKKQ